MILRFLLTAALALSACAHGPTASYDTSKSAVLHTDCGIESPIAPNIYKAPFGSMPSPSTFLLKAPVPPTSNAKGVLRVQYTFPECGGRGVGVYEVVPDVLVTPLGVPDSVYRYKVLREVPPSEWKD